jgi:hypothetical protein
MNLELFMGLVRHLLTFGGGFLVAQGVATQDEITTGVSAAAALFGVVWSVIMKWRAAS